MWSQELEEAARLVREAGKILQRIYATDFGVEFKATADPVTEADKAANAFLVAELRRSFPNDGVVAEESVDRSDALDKTRCWYVDPLDGTKEFVAKNGEFSVMIGLAVAGKAQVGAVYQPTKDKLYLGAIGVGAQLIEGEQRRPLQVSNHSDTGQLALVVSRSHRAHATDTLVQRLGIAREQRSGSVGLKVGLIAEQHADLYVHLSGHACLWDSCGPEAILRAAGGRFTDLYGKDIHYGGSELKNRTGLLACNAAAYDKVLPVVTALAQEHALC